MILRAEILVVVLAFAALPTLAINKCVGKDGKVTYQEGACPDDAKPSVMKASPAASGMLSAEEDVEDRKLATLVWAVSGFEKCSQASPTYARTNAKAWGEYRREHAELFARLERSKRYQESLRAARAKAASELKNPEERESLAGMCGP